jgi:uncharacterized protein YoxC
MSLSIAVVEKEYNKLYKERQALTETVNKLEADLGNAKSQLNATHGAVQVLEKLMKLQESELTLRDAEKELKGNKDGQDKK